MHVFSEAESLIYIQPLLFLIVARFINWSHLQEGEYNARWRTYLQCPRKLFCSGLMTSTLVCDTCLHKLLQGNITWRPNANVPLHRKKEQKQSCSIFASHWGFTVLSKEENGNPCQCLRPPVERVPSKAAGMTDSCSSLSLSWAKCKEPNEVGRRSDGLLSKTAHSAE